MKQQGRSCYDSKVEYLDSVSVAQLQGTEGSLGLRPLNATHLSTYGSTFRTAGPDAAMLYDLTLDRPMTVSVVSIVEKKCT